MLYITLNANGEAASASTVYSEDSKSQSRWDWHRLGFDHVANLAAQLTKNTGKQYIATDAGRSTSPQFDIIEAPTKGEPVSRYFNGDGYPAGTITKVSKSLRRVETSDGTVFFRFKRSGTWLNNGTWGMAHGHINERNPSF